MYALTSTSQILQADFNNSRSIPKLSWTTDKTWTIRSIWRPTAITSGFYQSQLAKRYQDLAKYS